MLRIAICDDDNNAVETHKKIAENCLMQSGSAGKIAVYTTSGNLLYDITEDGFFFDLILLDIEMPGNTGMEIAEKIKPHLPNVKIIFITSHIEYAIDAFELSIFRYVPKNDINKRLFSAIQDAIKLIELEDGKAYTNQLPRCKHSSTVLGSYVAAHSTCLSLLLPQARKRGMRICLSLLLHIIE